MGYVPISGPVFWTRALIVLLMASGSALAQNCPPIDLEKQKAEGEACRAAGGEWARFGAIAYLCNIYSCAERTRDGGKPCRARADCEHQCVTEKHAPIGTPASGRCTAVKTSYGCYSFIDGGRIIGRICVD
jgi:hypothetical protein